jgi:hypothetical protein
MTTVSTKRPLPLLATRPNRGAAAQRADSHPDAPARGSADKRRTKLNLATGAVTAAALLLAACGGNGGGAPIAPKPRTARPTATGSPTATSAPTATATPITAATPTFAYPRDVAVVVDADTTGNTTKDAVLRDQAYGQKAIFLAIATLDPDLPQLNRYLSAEALGNWINAVKWGQGRHESVTGREHFYRRTVTLTGPETATVTFCENSRDAYGKDTTTGRRVPAAPSSRDFTLHLSLMHKGADGIWTMTTYASQAGARRCRP